MNAPTRVRADDQRRFEVQVLPYLTDADEFPHPVYDQPLWSENYLTQAYDPDTDVGVYMHLSRTPFNPNVWLENFTVYLPGRRLLVYRGYGPNVSTDGAGGACLNWTCVDPYVHWIKRFEGGVQDTTYDELMTGPLKDGIHIGCSMELDVRSTSHVFDMGDVSGQEWGAKMHYEQHFETTGTIAFGNEVVEFTGTGLRDHSLGGRDLSKMSSHNWHSGNFPDGRGFNFSIVGWREADKSHSVGVVTTPDGIQMATVVNEPLIRAESEIWDPYEMVLRTEDGVEHVITAEVLSVMPHSLVGPNEIAYGNHTGTEASHLLLDCQTRYVWDGVVGFGLTERTVMRPRRQNDTYDLLVAAKNTGRLSATRREA